MKNLKTFILLLGIGCSALFAPPIYAGGCKFHGTTALSCEDGKGGYVNTFFNGEKWTEPVSSLSANHNVAPVRIIRVVEPIYIDNRDYICNRGYCRATYYPRYR